MGQGEAALHVWQCAANREGQAPGRSCQVREACQSRLSRDTLRALGLTERNSYIFFDLLVAWHILSWSEALLHLLG